MIKRRWPVLLALFLLIIITAVFIVEFFAASGQPASGQPVSEGSDINTAQVTALIENANPENGPDLIVAHDCAACHVSGAQVGIAPPFEGLAERAATRQPSLSAEEYIYESILNPLAYVVEGYTGAMPQNYRERLSDDDLGDIMAYLLQQR